MIPRNAPHQVELHRATVSFADGVEQRNYQLIGKLTGLFARLEQGAGVELVSQAEVARRAGGAGDQFASFRVASSTAWDAQPGDHIVHDGQIWRVITARANKLLLAD